MRNSRMALILFAALLAGLMVRHPLAYGAYQADTPGATPEHPLVGTWLIDLSEEGGRLLTLAADGTVIYTDVDGASAHGVWRATGETTGQFTTFQLTAEGLPDEPIFSGYFIITGTVTLDDAANRWSGELMVAQTDRAGIVEGNHGPMSLVASRLLVLGADDIVTGAPVAVLPSADPATP